MSRSYRTRYAPSPTGEMHMGHARTALVAWLRTRLAGGTLVMRFEDLDAPRVRPESEAAFLRDHAWLGLDFDEGPFRQSERHALYEQALETLGDRVFECTCTRREVRDASAPHGDLGPRYPGTCRSGPTHPERASALRFRMTEAEAFSDVFHGHQPRGEADDFIVRRSDGLFAYQLAVVVDDGEMGISEVVRGDDLLSATPRQIALHRALGYEPPSWLHVPLVVGNDGERLAKRHGAVGIDAYRQAGWSAERVLGVLGASMGVGEGEPMSLGALLESFELCGLEGPSWTPPSPS